MLTPRLINGYCSWQPLCHSLGLARNTSTDLAGKHELTKLFNIGPSPSAFAISRLDTSQNTRNGASYSGRLPALVQLLENRFAKQQDSAAHRFCRLAVSVDNLTAFESNEDDKMQPDQYST